MSTPVVDEIVYSPVVSRGLGRQFWAEMIAALVDSRELTWRFFLRNFSANYRQSALGYVWAVLPTIFTVGVFVYMSRARLLSIETTDLPYPLFLLVGLTTWQIFSTGLMKATHSLSQAGNLVVKINFPRETLVLAAFLESLVESAIRLALVVGGFIWFQIVPHWTVIFVPLVLLPLAILTIGIGLLLSITNAVFRDFGSGLSIAITAAMLLTPVVYPPPQHWPASAMNYLNPVSPFVTSVRDLVTTGTLQFPGALAGASLFSLFVFIFGWRTFHMAMSRIVERV